MSNEDSLEKTNQFLNNAYEVMRDNSFKVVKKRTNFTILKTPYGNNITINTKDTIERDELFDFVCSLQLNIPDIKQNEKIQISMSKKSFNIFNVASPTRDVEEFLSIVSNQIKNFDLIKNIEPALDFIAFQRKILSFTDERYYDQKNIHTKSVEIRFFHKIYKHLFDRIYYSWDESKNKLIDNYYSNLPKVVTLKESSHKILESQNYLENYIKNNSELLELYSQIKF